MRITFVWLLWFKGAFFIFSLLTGITPTDASPPIPLGGRSVRGENRTKTQTIARPPRFVCVRYGYTRNEQMKKREKCSAEIKKEYKCVRLLLTTLSEQCYIHFRTSEHFCSLFIRGKTNNELHTLQQP